MSLELKSEAMRKVVHRMQTCMTQVGSAALVDGSTEPATIDSDALTFLRNGVVMAGLTFNEGIIEPWTDDSAEVTAKTPAEPILQVVDGRKCKFLVLVNNNSTTTVISIRQGKIVLTAKTAYYPKVPDGWIVVGGFEVDSTQFFQVGSTAGDGSTAALPNGDLDDSDVTFEQFFWPTDGESAFALSTVGSRL